MERLIKLEQENAVKCDNINCDFVAKHEVGEGRYFDSIRKYLNVDCPKCGENLLTENDYILYLRFLKITNWVNKWFSWLTLIPYFRNKRKSTKVNLHKGFNIEE